MRPPEIHTVVILGAGNIAWHMGHCLSAVGIQVEQIFSRTPALGETLAAELQTGYTNRLDLLAEDADLYLLAVSDDAITSLLRQAQFGKQLVVHVAGSVSIEIFEGKAKNYGVLYPLQTLTRGKPVDFSNVPLFIEANNARNLEKLKALAGKMTKRVYIVDSEKRAYLHLAAVIASNFTNHMFALTEKVMQERNLSFDLIKPLIQETIAKALFMSPLQAQTGPAVRGNNEVIEKHMTMLENHPEIRELYRVISESIMAMKSEKLKVKN
jgi:predicted short-subunit dehydrogenase-like oxidoreductase (DUF2520 family)